MGGYFGAGASVDTWSLTRPGDDIVLEETNIKLKDDDIMLGGDDIVLEDGSFVGESANQWSAEDCWRLVEDCCRSTISFAATLKIYLGLHAELKTDFDCYSDMKRQI